VVDETAGARVTRHHQPVVQLRRLVVQQDAVGGQGCHVSGFFLYKFTGPICDLQAFQLFLYGCGKSVSLQLLKG
jgi:hypothetical protein